MERIFFGFLVFTPLAIAAGYLHAPALAVFLLSAIAIIPLAKYIGDSTEELAARTNPALGGLLNATFGNATELIIGFFALRAGLVEVVKASLTGSIIGNLLFVLGLAMLLGGWGKEKQVFSRTGALASGSSLFLAVIALVMPAIFLATAPSANGGIIEELSIAVSILLLCMYAAGLFFTLRTHKHLYTEELGHTPEWSVMRSVLTLLSATIAVAWVSEILVGAIEPIVESLGWTELFIGVIFIAIVGNAAEHFSAVSVALKNRMDLSLSIAIGSATQIALVAAPALVLLSLFFAQPMSLVFNTFELIALVLSVIIVNIVVSDGESNWLEGAQLLAAYAVMAIAFFLHP